MRKRLIAALMAFVLCAGMTMPSGAAYRGYSDVPEDHWSAAAVRRATELGIFQGIEENVFGRGQAISRAAFVTALVRMFAWEETTPEKATFSDVQPGKWYYTAVETAVENGAVAAVGENFCPADALTRGEMAAMLMRALGYTSLAATVNSSDCPFTDVTVNRGFITMAYDMGIVNGVEESLFAPNAFATREQAAAILVRVYDKLTPAGRELESAEGFTALRIDTPAAGEDDEIPTTPLEPVSELYRVLREMKNSGQDMDEVVLCLEDGGVRTVRTNQGWVVTKDRVDADEMADILARADVRRYYSERYESAYCVYSPNPYQTATVWYQSEESLAVKLQLARLFGVTKYVLE